MSRHALITRVSLGRPSVILSISYFWSLQGDRAKQTVPLWVLAARKKTRGRGSQTIFCVLRPGAKPSQLRKDRGWDCQSSVRRSIIEDLKARTRNTGRRPEKHGEREKALRGYSSTVLTKSIACYRVCSSPSASGRPFTATGPASRCQLLDWSPPAVNPSAHYGSPS